MAGFIHIVIFLFVTSCSSIQYNDHEIQELPASLQGGILVTFEVHGTEFNTWVTNPNTIGQIYAVRSGEEIASIPYGKVMPGPGIADHNEPYHWHLDPEDFEMVKEPGLSCVSDPLEVERNLDEYISDGKYFCPADANLVRVTDYRLPPPRFLTGN